MPSFVSTSWFPVFTLLLGYGLKAFSDWIQHRRTIIREREARDFTRTEKRYDRHIGLQWRSLLDLQETMHELGRYTARALYFDTLNQRADSAAPRKPLPEDINEGTRSYLAKTTLLIVRIHDDQVRAIADQLRSMARAVIYEMNSEDEKTRTLIEMSNVYDKLNERIGDLVRNIDNLNSQSALT